MINKETTAQERKLKICTNCEFLGLNNKPSNSCNQFLCFGTRPRHQTRAPWLGPPRLSQLVHILSIHSQAVVSLFIFPIGPIALDSEPHGRRYIKNMGHNRNRLYSRAIHSPTSMEKHYVQWFLLKSVYDITVVSYIFDVSSSTGLGIEGYRTYQNRRQSDLLER